MDDSLVDHDVGALENVKIRRSFYKEGTTTYRSCIARRCFIASPVSQKQSLCILLGVRYFVCVNMKARYFVWIIFKPDNFSGLDIRARYFFVYVLYYDLNTT